MFIISSRFRYEAKTWQTHVRKYDMARSTVINPLVTKSKIGSFNICISAPERFRLVPWAFSSCLGVWWSRGSESSRDGILRCCSSSTTFNEVGVGCELRRRRRSWCISSSWSRRCWTSDSTVSSLLYSRQYQEVTETGVCYVYARCNRILRSFEKYASLFQFVASVRVSRYLVPVVWTLTLYTASFHHISPDLVNIYEQVQ